MKIDQYTMNARVYPAVLCMAPILLLVFTIDDPTISKLLSDIVAVQILGQVTVSIAAFFLLMQISRTLGKDVFEQVIFKEELYFPTTEYLMPSCTELSVGFRTHIADKVNELFQLKLPSQEECEKNEMAARRQVRDIVARIRGAAGSPSLLLQRNWEYGFYRNLMGGSIVAIAASTVGAFWHSGTPVGSLFLILAIAYSAIIVCSRWLLRRNAGHYAQQLFHAFLGDER